MTEQGNANNVVMTDTNGEFRITLSSRKGSIEVSYVGYKTSTLDVTGVSDLEVKLESDNQVEEVVVVLSSVPAFSARSLSRAPSRLSKATSCAPRHHR